MNAKRVIVALDFPHADAALGLAVKLDPALCRVKIGKELFTAAGPALVERLQRMGFEIFLDLKFHDIPNTVAAACRCAAALGVWMLNVHALGGRVMMHAAREAIASVSGQRPHLIAVTVLTSLAADDLREMGIVDAPANQVMRLAALAQQCGLDGVVCSAQEAAELRAHFGAGFNLVTPGIRLRDSATDDQQRITTPAQAIELGADYLVIGRPITRASDPLSVVRAIEAEVAGALAGASGR